MDNTHAAWEFDQAVNAFNIGLISKEDLEKLACDLEPLIYKEWVSSNFQRMGCI